VFVSTIPADTAATQTPPAPPGSSPLRDWFTALRPRQWAKNVVVFAGLLFAGKVAHPRELLFQDLPLLLVGFVVFCAFSSVGYLINDVLDREKDRAHPKKRFRPIASGRIQPAAAIAMAIIIALLGTLISYQLKPVTPWHHTFFWEHAFLWVALAYLVETVTYSLFLKHQVILDLMTIPAGFLLRALAGTTLLGVQLSSWLFVCLMLVTLLVAIGKRLHELNLLVESGQEHRPVLADYSRPFLDHALSMAAAAAAVSYSVYCLTSPTAQGAPGMRAHPALVFTVPVVLYSLLRYMYLVLHADQGGQPEDIFLADRPMQIAILVWTVMAVGIFMWK